MRKNAPRKWLHAILDLLPVILIPVFMIYSHRHTIDSGSIQVPQNQVVNFNQLANQFNFKEQNDITFTPTTNGSVIINSLSIDGTASDYSWDTITSGVYTPNHKYFVTYNDDIQGIQMRYDGQPYTTGKEFIVLVVGQGNFSIDVTQGTTLDNVVVTPQVFDLTQMFGSGNEPTIQQFKTLYPLDYYEYNVGHIELLKGTSTITFDDTDIMSQSMYQLYNSVDKYFNMNNIFNMGAVYDWFLTYVFNGNAPIIMYVVWNIALYELVMDLMFLLYALFMWFVDWCKSLIERTYDVGRGK